MFLEAAAAARPLVELRGISRIFDAEDNTGVRGVNLTIWPGDYVAIVGPSGAGKSTLLNILGLLDRPDDGVYLLDSIDTARLPEKRRNALRSRLLGFIFQSSHVLGDENAIVNAGLGLRVQRLPLRERTPRAWDALRKVGLTGRAGPPSRLLSGGERQRLAIARAIATRPRLILADEPTGNLDTANGRQVIELLERLNAEGTSVIVVTHDESIAARAGRCIRVVDGQVSEEYREARPRTWSGEGDGPALAVQEPGRVSWFRRAWRTFADDLVEALSAMSNRAARTAFLALAFALGVGGLIASVGLSETAAAQVTQRLEAAALDEVRVEPPGGGELLRADDGRLASWIKAIRAIPHVTGVGFAASAGASSAHIRRLDPASRSQAGGQQLLTASSEYLALRGAGKVSPPTASLLDDPKIHGIALLGAGAAQSLGAAPPGPGSTLWVNGRRITVVGQVAPVAASPEIDQGVIVSRDVIADSRDVSVMLLVRTDSGFTTAVAEAIPLSLAPDRPGDFRVETVADLRQLRFGVSNDLGAMVGVLSAILLALAALSGATTMYLAVQSRTAEIALRRAIGAGRLDIARLFLVEGTLVGLLGGAIGVGLGTAGVVAGSAWQHWEPVLAEHQVAVGLALGTATGLISCLVPAWAASRKEPATAIRS